MGKVSERAKEVSERAREVTAASAGGGAEAMGRLANMGKEVSRRTREAHDALVLLRHSAGPEELPPEQEGLIGASHRLLRVELWAAADLRTSRIAEVAPCCALVVGSRGKPWAANAAAAPQVGLSGFCRCETRTSDVCLFASTESPSIKRDGGRGGEGE